MSVQNYSAMPGEELSLQTITATTQEPSSPTSGGRQLAQLKPADRGWSAWQVLIAAFVFEAVFFGTSTLPLSHLTF